MPNNWSLLDDQIMALPLVDVLDSTLFFGISPFLTPTFSKLKNGSRHSFWRAKAPSSQKSITWRQQELQCSHEPEELPPTPTFKTNSLGWGGSEVGHRCSKERYDLGFCLLWVGNPSQHAIQQDLLKTQTRSKADLSKLVSHVASQWALVPHHYVLIKLSYSSAKTHKSQGFTQSGFCHCN